MARAVIFDLGGVVYESPLHFIAEIERRHGLEPLFIARVVGGYGGADGPWQRLERGELSLPEFCERFDADLRAHGAEISTEEMMLEMAEHSAPRKVMLDAIRRLRAGGYLVAALTNNWVVGDEDRHDQRTRQVRELFDVFVESCRVGMRKPEPGIYELTCQKLRIAPADAVFLDDIGGNLKVARGMGMTTIKVTAPESALRELEGVVGLSLLG